MRLSIYGDHESAAALRQMFSHPTIDWNTKSKFPSCKITVAKVASEVPEIECRDSELRSLLLEQLEEQGLPRVVVTLGATKGLDIRIGMPLRNFPEEEQKKIEVSVLRALLFRARTRMRDLIKIFRALSLPAMLLIALASQAFGEPAEFIRLHAALLQPSPTGLIPFKVDLQRVGGTDLLGAQVVDQANSAFRVNVVAGGLSGTSNVNVTQFGGTNVSTGTGAGGTGIPRVTISNDSSLAANQSVNTAQFGGTNVATGTGAGGAGIPRVTISNDSSLAANQSVNVAQFGGTNETTGLGPGGAGIPRVTLSLDDMSGSVTFNAGTACPAASTSVVTSAGCIVVPMAGMSGVSFQVVNSSFSATVVPEYSTDGGTNWITATFYVAAVQAAVAQVYTTSSATQNYDIVVAGNYSHVRLRVSAFTSGSSVASGRATHIVPYINNPSIGVVGVTANIVGTMTMGTTAAGLQQPINTDVKGTQSTRGLGVQHLHDAGRTAISFYANAIASGTTGTETLITLTQSKGTGATSSAASYTITSGKTLRIERIQVASLGNATATAQTSTFNLRLNTAGACVVTSTPVLMGIATATPATSSTWDRAQMDIPEGYEIAGNGTIALCISANAVFTTNAPTWFVHIIGFEY